MKRFVNHSNEFSDSTDTKMLISGMESKIYLNVFSKIIKNHLDLLLSDLQNITKDS